jgi:hypothetical protein
MFQYNIQITFVILHERLELTESFFYNTEEICVGIASEVYL